MRKLFFMIFFLFLLLIPIVKADGIPWPRKPIVYEFEAVQEKHQYAFIEVEDKNNAVIHLYFSLVSVDAEDHNLTTIFPFKTIPTAFSGSKVKKSEFLQNYNFDQIRSIAQRQSLRNLTEKVATETSNGLEEYLKLSSGATLATLGFPGYVTGIYGVFAGRALAPEEKGVTPVVHYEFEGGILDIYQVESGATLEDFLKKEYKIDLPEKVKDAVDKYKSYYIGVLTTYVEPPVSKESLNLLKTYAPNTFQKMKDYVKTHPFIKIEVPGYYRGMPLTKKAGEVVPEYEIYYRSIRDIIKSKFSNFVEEAIREAQGKEIVEQPVFIGTTPTGSGHTTSTHTFTVNRSYRYVNVILDKCYNDYSKVEVTTADGQVLTDECGNNIPAGDTKCCCYIKEHKLDLGRVVSGTTQLKVWYRPGLYTGCPDAAKVYVSTTLTSALAMPASPVENAVIDFFYGVYIAKDTDKGVELSMALNLQDNEIFYPLGTGTAWSHPIEDIRVITKVPKELEVGFRGTHLEGIDERWRYYIWEYENKNPDEDIVGRVSDASIATKVSDSAKELNQTLYEKSGLLDAIISICIFALVGFFVCKKLKVQNPIPTLLATIFLSPLVTVFGVLIILTCLRAKPSKEILKENALFLIVLFALLVIIYIVLRLISWAI
jgi:hypothetical protein